MIEKTTEVVVKAKNITFSRAFFTAGETAETKKAKITRKTAPVAIKTPCLLVLYSSAPRSWVYTTVYHTIGRNLRKNYMKLRNELGQFSPIKPGNVNFLSA